MSALAQRAGEPATAPWRIWAALGIVYVVWGSTYLAIRVMVRTVPPLLGAGARYGLAGALMLGWLTLRNGRVHYGWRRLAGAAVVGTLLAAGGNGVVTLAELHVPSSLAALVIASVPLWIVVMRTGFGERPEAATMIGVVIGFAGVALLLSPSGHSSQASLGGLLLVAGAAVSWAGGSFASTRIALPRDPFRSTALQMLAGGAVLLVAGAARGEVAHVHPSAFSADSLAAFAYLVVAGSLVAFTSYVWLLQHAPVSKVATYAYVNPAVAILLGWIILSERITAVTLVGAAIILASVAFIVRREAAPAIVAPADADATLHSAGPHADAPLGEAQLDGAPPGAARGDRAASAPRPASRQR
jgi:drug/metabolite transporter (DMT)-like permease